MNKEKKNKDKDKYQKHLQKTKLYNYSAHDKVIFILSTFYLAFSLTVVKDFGSQYFGVIVFAWAFFAMAIIGLIFSFYVANYAIHYCRDSNFEKCNQWINYNDWLNVALGIFCSLGIILVVIFSYLNS